MAAVLVTGASGFVGSHLIEALLARGDDVRCLVRRKSQRSFLEQLGVSLVEGDVTQPVSLEPAVAGVDVVYNLAGMVSALRSADQMQVNGAGVENVARACAAQNNPPAHLLVSSIAAAGPSRRDRLRVETDGASPVSDYGRSKRQGELAAERWADRVPTTIVRPGIVFGPRDRQLFLMFRSIARFRLHAVPCRVPPRLSLIYAADLAQILMAAADSGERLAPREETAALVSNSSRADGESTNFSSEPRVPAGYGWADRERNEGDSDARAPGRGVYFACAAEYPDLIDLGHMLADATETRRVLYLRLAPSISWVVGGVSQFGGRLSGRPAALNVDKIREALAPSWACSGEKARRQLGFSPPKALAERLRETAGWYREQGWL